VKVASWTDFSESCEVPGLSDGWVGERTSEKKVKAKNGVGEGSEETNEPGGGSTPEIHFADSRKKLFWAAVGRKDLKGRVKAVVALAEQVL